LRSLAPSTQRAYLARFGERPVLLRALARAALEALADKRLHLMIHQS
jgi:hypothetical protein